MVAVVSSKRVKFSPCLIFVGGLDQQKFNGRKSNWRNIFNAKISRSSY